MTGSPIFGSLAPLAASFMGTGGFGSGSAATAPTSGISMPTITAPQRPSIQMPTPKLPSQITPAATTAAPAAYVSQKGETPGADGNMFYQGLQYSPYGKPVNGMQTYSTGTGNGTKYLTLRV